MYWWMSGWLVVPDVDLLITTHHATSAPTHLQQIFKINFNTFNKFKSKWINQSRRLLAKVSERRSMKYLTGAARKFGVKYQILWLLVQRYRSQKTKKFFLEKKFSFQPRMTIRKGNQCHKMSKPCLTFYITLCNTLNITLYKTVYNPVWDCL